MGIILKNYIDEDTVLGIWEIEENVGELLSRVSLDVEDATTLNSYKHEQRQLEWLSVRALMNSLLERETKIVYNEARKPFLHGNSYRISISHSHDMTAILVSKTKRVGIDLEFMSHRIGGIAFKFINEDERVDPEPGKTKYHLYLHWCAKEALYKICNKQDINFRENLTIKPFQLKDRGMMEGIVSNIHGREDFLLHYFRLDEYALVWCCK
jgi:4'-phosphopantetheinyl transferase